MTTFNMPAASWLTLADSPPKSPNPNTCQGGYRLLTRRLPKISASPSPPLSPLKTLKNKTLTPTIFATKNTLEPRTNWTLKTETVPPRPDSTQTPITISQKTPSLPISQNPQWPTKDPWTRWLCSHRPDSETLQENQTVPRKGTSSAVIESKRIWKP